MNIKNKNFINSQTSKSSHKKEYKHIDHAVFLTGEAVNELIIHEQAHEHVVVLNNKGYDLCKTDNIIKFSKGDLAVYCYILQHVANSFYTRLTHFEIGEALGFPTKDEEEWYDGRCVHKKECRKASSAIGRLCDTGYLINLKSIRGGKMIPLVRWQKEEPCSPSDGFHYYLDEEEQELAYSRQSQATVRMANRAKQKERQKKRNDGLRIEPF